ncbi:hypothetical protein C3V39_09555 [Prevotella sp. oral taxon 820]|nr:hypothetical protein C3V39_00060 [Prevotella sp. oral taxon 820]PTL25682.1 hypothetical protein C3V39_00480 [Prevotella sp. oral taxon 820]PTL27236.1 hypothetical protein C3V39_09555 [Prevotella sp. oral taxon 820]
MSFGRTKKGAKKPNEKHLVTFDSELRRLKSNKKPFLNEIYSSLLVFIFSPFSHAFAISLYAGKSSDGF